jgi:hypothetical protein
MAPGVLEEKLDIRAVSVLWLCFATSPYNHSCIAVALHHTITVGTAASTDANSSIPVNTYTAIHATDSPDFIDTQSKMVLSLYI